MDFSYRMKNLDGVRRAITDTIRLYMNGRLDENTVDNFLKLSDQLIRVFEIQAKGEKH